MAALCLVLYTIVSARMERSSSVIFGGAESGFANADINSANSRPTPTPEPTVDIWPQLTTKDFEDNVYLWIVNNDNLLSSAWEPEGGVSKIPGTRYMMYSTEYMQPLADFLDAIKAAGFEDVFVNASYRTYSYQRQAYNSKASQIAYEMTGGKTVDYTDPIYQEAAEQAKTQGASNIQKIFLGYNREMAGDEYMLPCYFVVSEYESPDECICFDGQKDFVTYCIPAVTAEYLKRVE